MLQGRFAPVAGVAEFASLTLQVLQGRFAPVAGVAEFALLMLQVLQGRYAPVARVAEFASLTLRVLQVSRLQHLQPLQRERSELLQRER